MRGRRLWTAVMRGRRLWTAVKPTAPDPILGLVARFKQDPDPGAVNLAQGAYRDDRGAPFVLPSVVEAERRVALALATGASDKEYLGIEGSPSFIAASTALALGANSPALAQGRVAAFQTLSGTGALRIAAESLSKVAGVRDIYLSNPSWANHAKIFQAAGLRTHEYTYLDTDTGTSLDMPGLLADLKDPNVVPDGAVVLLHACAHNPTGIDPTQDQWRDIANVFQARDLKPLFDSAYQGYASGDLETDAFPIRLFERRGIPSIVCQSFAKSMGLYGERVGAMFIVTESPEEMQAVLSQVKQTVIRPMYSSPPLHGARLATMLLTDTELNAQWQAELKGMVDRIETMRQSLVASLEAEEGRSWTHITDQIGMFAFTGLTSDQVDCLLDDHGIYLPNDGRISLAGMKPGDIEKVASAMRKVVAE
jgi:aspartate aminotransferase